MAFLDEEKTLEHEQLAGSPEPTSGDLSVRFLLEEYRNIAATHDRLRDVGLRLLNFAFIVAAFPFTIAGLLFGKETFNLFAAPASFYVLAIIVSLAEFSFGYGILDARLSQYRYARTVNLVRKYFSDLDPGLSSYLYLPQSAAVPKMDNLGYVRTQLRLIILLGALFFGYGLSGLYASVEELFIFPPTLARVAITLASGVAYYVSFHVLRDLHVKRFDSELLPSRGQN